MEELFKILIVLSHYLKTGRFRQFWEEVAKSRQLVEALPGFEQAVQSYAIHFVSLTYQKVPRAVLAEAVNIEGPSQDKLIEHQHVNSGWMVEKGQGRGQVIVIPPKEFNQPESKKNAVGGIPLDHITRIFPILGKSLDHVIEQSIELVGLSYR